MRHILTNFGQSLFWFWVYIGSFVLFVLHLLCNHMLKCLYQFILKELFLLVTQTWTFSQTNKQTNKQMLVCHIA